MFNNREKAFEERFAHDSELQFRVTARRDKLLGLWAAEKMGLTSEEADAYAKSVVQADFEEVGEENLFRKIHGDLTARNAAVTEHEVRHMMAELMTQARAHFMAQS